MLVEEQGAGKPYRSPKHKLLAFFERSRDRWKGKYRALRRRCKLLENQTRAVEKSRSRWCARANQAEQRVRELEQALAEQKI